MEYQEAYPDVYLESNTGAAMVVDPGPQTIPYCFCHPIDFFDLYGDVGEVYKTICYLKLNMILAKQEELEHEENG